MSQPLQTPTINKTLESLGFIPNSSSANNNEYRLTIDSYILYIYILDVQPPNYDGHHSFQLILRRQLDPSPNKIHVTVDETVSSRRIADILQMLRNSLDKFHLNDVRIPKDLSSMHNFIDSQGNLVDNFINKLQQTTSNRCLLNIIDNPAIMQSNNINFEVRDSRITDISIALDDPGIFPPISYTLNKLINDPQLHQHIRDGIQHLSDQISSNPNINGTLKQCNQGLKRVIKLFDIFIYEQQNPIPNVGVSPTSAPILLPPITSSSSTSISPPPESPPSIWPLIIGGTILIGCFWLAINPRPR